MKKTIKAITAVMVVLTLCFGLLAGCGSSPVGSWKVVSVDANGMTVDVAETGMDVSDLAITVNSDGTVSSNGFTIGNWTLNGNTFTIVEDGTSIECEYTGSNIIMDMGIGKLIYVRA